MQHATIDAGIELNLNVTLLVVLKFSLRLLKVSQEFYKNISLILAILILYYILVFVIFPYSLNCYLSSTLVTKNEKFNIDVTSITTIFFIFFYFLNLSSSAFINNYLFLFWVYWPFWKYKYTHNI